MRSSPENSNGSNLLKSSCSFVAPLIVSSLFIHSKSISMRRSVFNAILLVGLLAILTYVVFKAISHEWAQATFFLIIVCILATCFDRGKVTPSDNFFNPKKKKSW